jgi:YD repeat-containing protein
VSTNLIVRLSSFGILVFAFCIHLAAQNCIPFGNPTPPPNDPYLDWFGYVAGAPLIPGMQCVCGVPLSGSGIGEADCFVPKYSKHACPTCTKTGGSPISLATGNTFITQQDVRVPGLGGGLTLVRTWNSVLRASLSSIGLFGPNWRSNFEERIYVDDDGTIAYARGDGSVWNFVVGASTTFNPPAPPNTLFTFKPASPSNVAAALFYGSAWTLVFQNGEQRVFDGVSGNLLSITDRNGNMTQLTYDASYRLITVADAASRHLYFSYPNATTYLVTSVTSDVGISLTYTYDGLGRLIQYTKPDSTTVSFQYNNVSNSILITSVLDQNGIILESHTYDNLGRGLTSSRAGGVEAVTVTYPSGALALP